jgi:chemotaxis protein methyltransferase CheR
MLPDPIDFFAALIERETGIVYSETNKYQLNVRLEEICKSEKIASIQELAALFQKNSNSLGLKQKLLDLATNNETLFFRDPVYFSAIESFVSETLAKENIRDLKIWSAASSTGQEAISLAITMEELLSKHKINSYSITATDICEKALQKCKSGLYTEFEVMRGLPAEKRDKYFKKEGDLWRVRPALHAQIRFGHNNLIRSSVYEKFHLILCRNVLIYQKVHQKKVVIEMLLGQLEPSGALLLGAGETVVGLTDNVHTQSILNVSFYRRNMSPKAAAS